MKKAFFFVSLLGSVSFTSVAATISTVGQLSSKINNPGAINKPTRKPLDVVCITQGCDNGTSATGCGSNAAEAKQALATALAFGCGG
ncbi:MAG: hypothetical protein ACRYF0_16165 [Janthinobacterium lividum]